MAVPTNNLAKVMRDEVNRCFNVIASFEDSEILQVLSRDELMHMIARRVSTALAEELLVTLKPALKESIQKMFDNSDN